MSSVSSKECRNATVQFLKTSDTHLFSPDLHIPFFCRLQCLLSPAKNAGMPLFNTLEYQTQDYLQLAKLKLGGEKSIKPRSLNIARKNITCWLFKKKKCKIIRFVHMSRGIKTFFYHAKCEFEDWFEAFVRKTFLLNQKLCEKFFRVHK